MIKLGTWELLQQFAVTDILSFPPGYEEAITTMLAIELAPYYDMAVSQALSDLGADAVSTIQRVNGQGLGGAFGESETLQAPNVGIPPPSQAAPQGGPPAQ